MSDETEMPVAVEKPVLVVDTAHLARLCEEWSAEPYVTVDTEFMREKTYYAQLCLVQVAGAHSAVAIDPLAKGLDLKPLLDLMANKAVVKVFHAARQDLEIFHQLMGELPQPVWDSQVAAMICGYGEQVGYDKLVSKFCGKGIDKGSRFTDWARRPLSEKQLDYALCDVTYLREIYEGLVAELAQRGRTDWVDEEMLTLRDDATYRVDLETIWRRLKPRNDRPKFLSIVRELAAYREQMAQDRDLPRSRIIRDDTLLDIAAQFPTTTEDLAASRGVSEGLARGKIGQGLLAALKRGLERSEIDPPERPQKPDRDASGPLLELLKVLLKARAEQAEVAARVIANAKDLEQLVIGEREVAVLEGWRKDMFGDEALRLIEGKIALTVVNRKVSVVEIS